MSLRSNLFASLASSAWTACLGLAVVPWYIRLLGMDSYGLVGILATVQAVFSVLDLGLAAAMNREVSRAVVDGQMQSTRQLLGTLTAVYWTTALVILMGCTAMAPVIQAHWLQPSRLDEETVEISLILIGLVVACRWPSGLYVNVLLGAQRAVVSSVLTVVFGTAASLGAVIVLSWFTPDIKIFLAWQAACGLAYAMALRSAAWRALGSGSSFRFRLADLAGVWRFSAALSGVGLTAIVLTQVDKAMLSGAMSLAAFGEYALAVSVGSSLYLMTMPVFGVIYPKFAGLIAAGDTEGLSNLYRSGSRLFAIAIFSAAMLTATFAEELVAWWTGDSALAHNIAPIVALLACAAAVHGMVYFPYALQLANGMTTLTLAINGGLVVVALPLTAVLVRSYGALGAATASLLIYSGYLLVAAWQTHRRVFHGQVIGWLCGDVGMPLFVSLGAAVIGSAVVSRTLLSSGQKGLLALAMLVGTVTVSLALAPRSTVRRAFGLIGARAAT